METMTITPGASSFAGSTIQDSAVAELVEIARAIHAETMEHPVIPPHSPDSYLPHHMRKRLEAALAGMSAPTAPTFASVLADALAFNADDQRVIEVYLRGCRLGPDLDPDDVRETSDDVLREAAVGRQA